MTDLTPPPEVDRTMIREWIAERVKTDEHLLNRYHNDAVFYTYINALAQTDDNQEATDLIISIMLGEFIPRPTPQEVWEQQQRRE